MQNNDVHEYDADDIELGHTPSKSPRSRGVSKVPSFGDFTEYLAGGSAKTREGRVENEKHDIGRDRDDTAGEEFPLSATILHILKVFCFFIGCWFFIGIDALHSYLTGVPRGIGDKKVLKPGTGHLSSWVLTSRLDPGSNSKGEDGASEGFIRRYYKNCDIFDTFDLELKYEARKFLQQLYIDTTDRRQRKAAGDRFVLWVTTIFGIGVATVAFARVAQQEEKQGTQIDLSEGIISLILVAITQSINRKTQADGEATKALEKLDVWARELIEKRQKETRPPRAVERIGSSNKKLKFKEVVPEYQHNPFKKHMFNAYQPMETQLYQLKYSISPTKNLDYSLFEAVAKLRTKLGFKTTIKQVNTALKAMLTGNSDEVSQIELANPNTLEIAKKLAVLYDCPIFIISEDFFKEAIEIETAFHDEKYCLLLNEKADAEETKQSEASAMILYMAGPEEYQAVLPLPTPKGEQRSFQDIKQELMGLAPDNAETLSSNYSADTI
ncbi:MAG: hypothetical protein QNK11_01840 [Legionella sp.]|nr:hypothetical protein [Legionella sp.]